MKLVLTVIMAVPSVMPTLAAQARDSTGTAVLRQGRDSAAIVHRVDCVSRGPARVDGPAADSLCLSRAEAIAAAVLRNPQIAATKEQVAQARARRVQGVAIPDPAMSFEVDQATGLFGGQAQDKVLNASLTIPFPDKFRLRGKIGRADIQSTEASLAQLQQSIAAQTSQTYDSILAAIRHGENLSEGKRLADDFLKKTEARFQAGSTARLDVIKARVDVAQAENDLILSERDVTNARAALNRLIDRPLGAPIAVSDSLVVPPDLPPLERLEAAALAARPELAGLERQRDGARANTSLIKQFWLPDLTVGLSHNYADPGPGVLFTGIAMPLPIFYWQHSKGEIAEAKHKELELTANARDLRAQIGLDVRTAYASASTALRQVIFLRDQLIPSAREAYRIASVSYGLGGSSALEVLDARRGLRDAENQYTDALAAANMARADLERAVGDRSPESGPRAPMTNRRVLLAASFAALSLAGGCSRAPAAADQPARPADEGRITLDSAQRSRLRVQRIDSVTFSPMIITTGTVAFSADRSTQILAPMSGPVSAILVNPGANVVAGQPLATVASADFAAAIASYRKADAAWRNAKRIADLDEQLFTNDALARRELDQARTDLAGALADKEAALQQLKSLGVDDQALKATEQGQPVTPIAASIRSPIAGAVVEKLITPGQLLQAATPCFTIADLSTMWVMANVFEQDVRSVHRGDRVIITTDASPDSLAGVVDYVAALVDPSTKATAVRLIVPNKSQILKRDMLVQVAIRSQANRKGLLVPVAAVLRDDENLPYLFVAMADGTFARRRVSVGSRLAAGYHITSGLVAGESVVVDGALFLPAAGHQ